ncbi:hypothetical protein [Phenylobacterium sp.]|uniref:hypothetical protein n=1 Tax=Phenylobacterium sp. TaxID=1871053 RepID=UPI001223715E|nr:hypothetical protein [Phenylobacterium sp.]THD62965.1 MAG: hypothetical protein E8A49_06310 [Phenylobacterium sp.]
MTTRFSDLPKRVQRLPTDRRGFPVPWFVAWRDGEPQFPVVDAAKLGVAWAGELCWVCGDKLGALRGWVVGPMSALEGATPEPPSHYDCARFSVRCCPHLSTPTAKPSARYGEAEGYAAQANVSKLRSGATAIWVTRGRGATPFHAGGGLLFGLEGPERLEWYAAGRPASAADVRAAIARVLPTLRRVAEREGRAPDLARRLQWLDRWTPTEAASREG